MIVKARRRQLKGFDAQYVPGWDCHGLPIENAIEKSTAATSAATTCRPEPRLRHRADRAADGRLQAPGRAGRLGAGTTRRWTQPTRAGEIRAFKRVIERGFVYRGLKPVYWCFDCGSSLAEFEIEYADKKSQTIDIGFLCAEAAGSWPAPSA